MYKNVIDQVKFEQLVISNSIKNYVCPTTYNEYWMTVNTYWSDLLNIMLMYLPEYVEVHRRFELKKTAVFVTELMQTKDIRLVDKFQQTWTSAPDDGYIHSIKGWGILCDLCSESYLVCENNDL